MVKRFLFAATLAVVLAAAHYAWAECQIVMVGGKSCLICTWPDGSTTYQCS